MGEDKYHQIACLADWVHENKTAIAEDGMNVIIAIADDEGIRKMCLSGDSMKIGQMIHLLIDGINQKYGAVS